ncbi:hypothetical protein C1H76_0797 [Elsinoe australis]|uniref:Uncharacterized protein n=1 Tax=Elsinoe australis TaxID=40998 RepID=A0A4V6DV60_9PEZI|nr:hypothetical protein C1H76_0797 [Elsinoe australis]
MRPPWLLACIALLYTTCYAQDKTCYFLTGGIASGDKPCPGYNGDGPCCPSNRACGDDNLCGTTPGDPSQSRGSCTDKSWDNPNCPQYCLGSGQNAQIPNCTETLGLSEPRYCCGNTQAYGSVIGCCQFSTNLFAIQSDAKQNPIVVSTTSQSSATPTSATTSTQTTTSGTQTSSGMTSGTSSGTTTTTSAGSSTSTGSTTSATSSTSSAAPAKDNTVALGAGLGAGLGVPLLACIGIGFWLLRRRQNQQAQNSFTGGGSGYSPYPPSINYHYQDSSPLSPTAPASQQVHEAPPFGARHELMARERAHEVDGTGYVEMSALRSPIEAEHKWESQGEKDRIVGR